MPKPVTAPIDETELKMTEPASSEEMERRRLVASRLRALRDRSMTEAEKEFWREFDATLENERLSFCRAAIDAEFAQMASDRAYQEEAVQVAEDFAEADWEALRTVLPC